MATPMVAMPLAYPKREQVPGQRICTQRTILWYGTCKHNLKSNHRHFRILITLDNARLPHNGMFQVSVTIVRGV